MHLTLKCRTAAQAHKLLTLDVAAACRFLASSSSCCCCCCLRLTRSASKARFLAASSSLRLCCSSSCLALRSSSERLRWARCVQKHVSGNGFRGFHTSNELVVGQSEQAICMMLKAAPVDDWLSSFGTAPYSQDGTTCIKAVTLSLLS